MNTLATLFDDIGQRILTSVEQLKTDAEPLQRLLNDLAALPGVQIEIDHGLSNLYAYADSTGSASIAIMVTGLDSGQLRAMADAFGLHWFVPKDGQSVIIGSSPVTLHIRGLTAEPAEARAA